MLARECARAFLELLEGDSDADGGFAVLGQKQDGGLADYTLLLGSQADLPVDDVDAAGGDGLLSEEAGVDDYGALLGPLAGAVEGDSDAQGDAAPPGGQGGDFAAEYGGLFGP